MKFPFRLFLLFCFCSFYLTSLQETDSEFFPCDYDIETDLVHFDKEHEYKTSVYKSNLNYCVDISQLDPVLSAECEPLTTIADCVNVISGHFFQVEKDLASHSIEPLSLIRYYDSGNTCESTLGFGFGLQFPLWISDIQDGARHFYAMISEREGVMIPYRGKSDSSHGKITCSVDTRLLKKGYTNLSRVAISSHTNFTNWKAFYQKDRLMGMSGLFI